MQQKNFVLIINKNVFHRKILAEKKFVSKKKQRADFFVPASHDEVQKKANNAKTLEKSETRNKPCFKQVAFKRYWTNFKSVAYSTETIIPLSERFDVYSRCNIF